MPLVPVGRKIEIAFIVDFHVIGLKSCEAKTVPLCDTYHAIDGTFPDAYRPPVDVIFGQLLGLYSSIAFGLQRMRQARTA